MGNTDSIVFAPANHLRFTDLAIYDIRYWPPTQNGISKNAAWFMPILRLRPSGCNLLLSGMRNADGEKIFEEKM
jgi:hypothetical protein